MLPTDEVYVLVSPAGDVHTEFLTDKMVRTLPPSQQKYLGPKRNGPAVVCFESACDAEAYLRTMPPGWTMTSSPLYAICAVGVANCVSAALIRDSSGRETIAVAVAPGTQQIPSAFVRNRIENKEADPNKHIMVRKTGSGCTLVVPTVMLAAAGLLGKCAVVRQAADRSAEEKNLTIIEDKDGLFLEANFAAPHVAFRYLKCPSALDNLGDGEYLEVTISGNAIYF